MKANKKTAKKLSLLRGVVAEVVAVA